VSVETTEIYASTGSKQKREAIEKAYVDIVNKGGGPHGRTDTSSFDNP